MAKFGKSINQPIETSELRHVLQYFLQQSIETTIFTSAPALCHGFTVVSGEMASQPAQLTWQRTSVVPAVSALKGEAGRRGLSHALPRFPLIP